MILEQMIHNIIRTTFNKNEEFRQFAGKDKLLNITREDIECFQLFRLNKILNYVSEKSVFYKDIVSRIGELKSPEHMERIPFTDPEDLARSPYKLLCISMSRIARIFSHTSTGTTTGRLKKVFFTHSDAKRIIDSMAAIIDTVFESAGLDLKGRSVQIFLPNNGPPFSIAGLIAKSAQKLDMTAVIGDCSATSDDQVKSIQKVGPDMLMGSAFRVWRITLEGGLSHDLRKIGVKTIFITSEYVSSPMRKRLEDSWDAEVFHHYGMTEPGFVIGVECQAHDGFHFNEADLLFEVVDTETGKVIDGEGKGELVLTTLNREGMPLIRYKTGDVADIIRRPCRCGASTLVRIGKIPKRMALIVDMGNGEKIYTSLLDEALYRIPDLIDYRLFLSTHNSKDSLTCKIEVLGKEMRIKEQVSDQLLAVPAISKSIEDNLLSYPRIEIVKRGILRRGGRSLKRRIVDNRQRH